MRGGFAMADGSPRGWGILLVGAFAMLGMACSDGGEEEGSGEGQTVQVTLQEFAVSTDRGSANAGPVTFQATNEGPEDDHEFVVIKTDLALTDLPTEKTGAVDENGEGIEVIGEIEEFPPGETRRATFDLESGAYVLICNVFDKAEDEAHYEEGMRTSFTVG
jgi:uncharacterized cupredoxin-like copper-binding protein